MAFSKFKTTRTAPLASTTASCVAAGHVPDGVHEATDKHRLRPDGSGVPKFTAFCAYPEPTISTNVEPEPVPSASSDESIYNMLTAYFKAAKARRQIILITHNPNLVVNSDSEQVIIATATRRETGLPHITYRSGALENSAPPDRGIRQQVCRILEGGSDAFRKRERRYALEQH